MHVTLDDVFQRAHDGEIPLVNAAAQTMLLLEVWKQLFYNPRPVLTTVRQEDVIRVDDLVFDALATSQASTATQYRADAVSVLVRQHD